MTIKQSNTCQVLGTPPNTTSPYAAAVRTFTPCCHFTGEQSEVLNAFFCLRTHSPELHVAKAHHLPPKGAKWEVSHPLEEHIDQVQGPGKICPLCALCAQVPAPPRQPGGRRQRARLCPHPATPPTCHPDLEPQPPRLAVGSAIEGFCLKGLTPGSLVSELGTWVSFAVTRGQQKAARAGLLEPRGDNGHHSAWQAGNWQLASGRCSWSRPLQGQGCRGASGGLDAVLGWMQ